MFAFFRDFADFPPVEVSSAAAVGHRPKSRPKKHTMTVDELRAAFPNGIGS